LISLELFQWVQDTIRRAKEMVAALHARVIRLRVIGKTLEANLTPGSNVEIGRH
jgi:hypothetical protein